MSLFVTSPESRQQRTSMWCAGTEEKPSRQGRDLLEEPGPLHVYRGCAKDNAIPGCLVSKHCMQRCERAHALAPHKCCQACLISQADVL